MWVIVPAAGSGKRFGAELPKQYLEIAGRSVLIRTIDALLGHREITGLVVVHSEGDRWIDGALVDQQTNKTVLRCLGGATRAESVLCGLHALPNEVDGQELIAVHDAARPCVLKSDLTALFAAARQHSIGAILAEPVRDTVKQVTSAGQIQATLDRNLLWRAQTPQVFRRAALEQALRHANQKQIAVTDESHAMELQGWFGQIVAGSSDNLKITVPQDLLAAEQIFLRRIREPQI